MSTLTSSSTDTEVAAAYDDNASYVEDGSATKARAFITACRFLLRRMPRSGRQGQLATEFNPDLIRDEMRAAQAWLNAHGGTNEGVKHLSLQNFRN